MSEELERILSREVSPAEQYAAMDRLKVGIVGISSGAGAGFLTGCLARYLANTGKHNPTVIEMGRGSLFDSYGMDKRFAGRPYYRFFQTLSENRSIRGYSNADEGISWVLRSPEERRINLTFEQKLRLIALAKGDVILCDLSGEEEPDFQLLRYMDRIIAIIDPMPSRMLGGYQALCRLKTLEEGRDRIIYVINKINNGVNRRQMLDFLKVKKPIFIPLADPESIYTAEYNCRIPYSISSVKSMLKGPLGEIADAIVSSR